MTTLKTVHVQARQLAGFKNEAHARDHTLILDQPQPLGGDGGATPLEFLQMALAGCFISTGYIIARQRGLDVRTIAVDINGALNPEVTAGRNSQDRAGYAGLEVKVQVDGGLSQAEKEAFVAEIRRRCPVSDNLEHPTPLSFDVA